MLHLVMGKDWVANRDALLERIGGDVKNKKGNRILLVPELISHDMERRLCAHGGDTASRYAQVLSFTRLARRVAECVGAAAEECLDDGGRVVAMAAAARQLHSRLKAYAALETKPEFLTELVNAVDEFKRCGISAADLMQASLLTQGSLAQKLEELSLILEAYDGLCARGKKDPRDQMNWLLEQLEDGDFAASHVFYIVGFPDFTRQHLAILEHLIRESPGVTIALTCDAPGSSGMAFEKAGQTALELLQCAKRSGIEVTREVIRPIPSALLPLREAVFQGSIPSISEDHLWVSRTETLYQECQTAAQQVLELAQQGVRYRDIGIVCGDMQAYQHAISLTFGRMGIPFYQSGNEDILNKPGIRTVLCALDAALGGFEQRRVLRYLKSGLTGDGDILDRLENYAILWGIGGSRWLQPFENHPRGLGVEWSPADREELEALEAARQRCIEPLAHLAAGFREAKTLAQQVLSLNSFLEEIRLSERLDALAEQWEAAGDLRGAQMANQLWDILVSALEQLYAVLGELSWDGEVFVRLLSLLLRQYDVGTIPPVLDAVTVGAVSSMRCQQVKHLFVLGALEGQLPGYSGASGVLNDQERLALRQLGVPLTGGAMEGLQAEFAEIYEVFAGASESIRIFCPAGQPSYLYQRFAGMAGCERKPDALLGSAAADPWEAGAYLARFGDAQAAERLGIGREYWAVRQQAGYGLGSISRETIEALYGKTLHMSASRVDKQAQCRLQYFLQYGLFAQERKEAAVDPMEFGTYVHAVLEKTAAEVVRRGGFHQVSREQTLAVAMEYAAEYVRERFGQLDSRRLAYLLARNGQELSMVVGELWDELSRSRFVPVGFEVGFGAGDREMPPIHIHGNTMDAQLEGFVDRVDAWQELGQNYFRVVDYKTGKRELDYCDLYNGLGLQMLLYLFALEQGGQGLLGKNPKPAGVQYFPAHAKFLSADGRLSEEEARKERERLWQRSGLLLADGDVLRAMEPEESKRLCCTWKKDGTLTGYIATREQLRELEAYIHGVLGNMVDEIASGKVLPNPYTRGSSFDACAYCPYGAVCHKAGVEGRRNYQRITAEEFWENIAREVEKHG